MSEHDPVETTLTIDHDRKILLCWTNHKATIKQWVAHLPEYAKPSKDGTICEMNNLPISAAKKIKVSKRISKDLTEDERQILRDRMLKIRANL